MSGDQLTWYLKNGENEKKINGRVFINLDFCTYKGNCKINRTVNSQVLCSYCKYFKRDFDVPELIEKALKERKLK
jgi:hypothetical protein